MDIGISTGYLYNNDIKESLIILNEAGYKIVEIWASPDELGKLRHFNWRDKNKVEEVLLYLKEHNIKVHSIHAPFSADIDISNTDEDKRKESVRIIYKIFEILNYFGGDIVVVHPSSISRPLNEKDKEFSQCRKSINDLVKTAEKYRLRIALENQLLHILGGDIDTLLGLIDGYPKEILGICFDSSHANLYPGKNIERYLIDVSKYLMTLHISDNQGVYDDHLMPGDGDINWEGFLKTLFNINYSGPFILEVIADTKTQDHNKVLTRLKKRIENMLTGNNLIERIKSK